MVDRHLCFTKSRDAARAWLCHSQHVAAISGSKADTYTVVIAQPSGRECRKAVYHLGDALDLNTEPHPG